MQLAARAAPQPRARLSPTAAFYLQASITVAFLAGSSAPSPLYPVYQAAWGFSSLAITVIFGVYAFAVLVALLVAGRISDHVGRRPVLLAATLVQAITMIVFATAGGLTSLLVARVIQGLPAGAAVAAVGAGLARHRPLTRHHRELDRCAPRHRDRRPHRRPLHPVPAGADSISSIWRSARCSSCRAWACTS